VVERFFENLKRSFFFRHRAFGRSIHGHVAGICHQAVFAGDPAEY
jgi:hypothetical protein